VTRSRTVRSGLLLTRDYSQRILSKLGAASPNLMKRYEPVLPRLAVVKDQYIWLHTKTNLRQLCTNFCRKDHKHLVHEFNVCGRSRPEGRRQSNLAYQRPSHARWYNPAPPIHGRRSLRRFKWDWRSSRRQSPRLYRVGAEQQALSHGRAAGLLFQVGVFVVVGRSR